MKNTTLVALLVAAGFIAGCSSVPSINEVQKLKPPAFKAAVIPAAATCGVNPKPMFDITLENSFYTDNHTFSVIDKNKFAKMMAAKKPIEDFEISVERLSNTSIEYGMPEYAKCAIAFIDEWARADAMLGPKEGDYSSQNEQLWLLSAISTDYYVIQEHASLEQDVRIRFWLQQLSLRARARWDNVRDQEFKGNKYAMTAAGVMTTAILNNDKAGIDWARSVFKNQMGTVTKEGGLTAEVRRGQMALHYHYLALLPLTYMALLSKNIGEDWGADPRLRRVQQFVANSTLDKNVMSKYVGATQKFEFKEEGQWGWYGFLDQNDPIRVQVNGVVTGPFHNLFNGGDPVMIRKGILAKQK